MPSSIDTVAHELPQRHVRFTGSALALRLLKLFGWRIRFDGLPSRQGLLIFYPHTSHWDLLVVLMGKWAAGLPATFLVPEGLMRTPVLGFVLQRLGGLRVDRSQAAGQVAQMVASLREARARGSFCWLGMTPEGTRDRTEGWRSGFHHVAVQAGVPVALVTVDYPGRCIGVAACLRLSGDAELDMALIARHVGGACGRHPQRAAPVKLRVKKTKDA